MDARTTQTYDTIATAYDAETSDFWQKFPVDIIGQFVTHLRGTNILDVGSGPGRDALLLQKAGMEVVCLDASRAMVELSSERGLVSVQGDLLDLPFDAGVFDGVWAYTSLLHVKKIELVHALKNIRRVLTHDGVLGLGMIEGEEELYRTDTATGTSRWFAYYTHGELEQYLHEAGFAIEHFVLFTPGKRNYLNFVCSRT